MNVEALNEMCRTIRTDILNMIFQAGSGHPGGSLSAVELLTGLYFGEYMKVDPKKPQWEDRDYFILSKGHVAPVLYSVLARKGYFDPKELNTLRKYKSRLQGHPNMKSTPGIDCSSGSLGQGLSVANGIAMACRMKNKQNRVYCLLGDGEMQEGQVWEAMMTAAQHNLDNVCAIVDVNGVQLDGRVEDIKDIGDIGQKWRDFGWNVIELDGHNMEEVRKAYGSAQNYKGKPTVLIAYTIKGKGVSFMENDCHWHGNVPNAQQLQDALAEINCLEGK